MNDNKISEEQAFEALDKVKTTPSEEELNERIAKRAEEIAEQKVQEKLKAFGQSISGDNVDEERPKDWKEVFKKQEETAKEVAQKTYQQLKKEDEERQKQARERQQQSIAERNKKMSSQWWDLISEEKLPKPSEEVLEKLKKGEGISEAEIRNDNGIQAWFKIKEMAEKSGKTFKEAYYEDFSAQPAGARAPVFGAASSNMGSSDDEYSYEEIRNARIKSGIKI